jgi:pilus assembly protein CpaE
VTHSVVGLTLVVHGAKGGVGASLLASQVALAAAGRARTALVDLDVSGGTCSALLGVEERGSMLSLLGHGVGRGEVAAVARRHPSGLALLAAEPFDAAAGLLDGAAVRRLLELARRCFDVVVVDVPARLDDRGVAALAAADKALLVVTPEVPCVVAARRLVDALAWRDFPLARLGVVVNMLEEAEGVTPEQIAAAISLRLTGTIPFAPKPVRQSINSAREHNGSLEPGTAHTAIAALSAHVVLGSTAAAPRPEGDGGDHGANGKGANGHGAGGGELGAEGFGAGGFGSGGVVG